MRLFFVFFLLFFPSCNLQTLGLGEMTVYIVYPKNEPRPLSYDVIFQTNENKISCSFKLNPQIPNAKMDCSDKQVSVTTSFITKIGEYQDELKIYFYASFFMKNFRFTFIPEGKVFFDGEISIEKPDCRDSCFECDNPRKFCRGSDTVFPAK